MDDTLNWFLSVGATINRPHRANSQLTAKMSLVLAQMELQMPFRVEKLEITIIMASLKHATYSFSLVAVSCVL